MKYEELFDFYKKYRGELTGSFIGFFVAILFLIIGFLKTIFIAICISLGYYVGKRLSSDKDCIKNFLDRILPPGTYR